MKTFTALLSFRTALCSGAIALWLGASLSVVSLSGCSSRNPAPPAPLPPPTLEGPTPLASASTAAPVAATPAPTATAVVAPPEPTTDVDRTNQVAAAFVREAGKAPGNTFVSPASLRLALGMPYVGAQGTTQEEMKKSLAFGDAAAVASAAKAEIASWSALNGKDVQISVANRLYAEKTQALDKAFTGAVKDGWGAPVDAVDFKGNAENARKGINGWVKKQTKERIVDLLPEGSLDGQTRLVLVNAIYLDAKWTTPFEKNATSDRAFVTASGTPVTAPFMRRLGKARYGETPEAKVLEMGYGKGDLAMVFVLPKKNDGIAALEQGLSHASFAAFRAALADENRVEIAIPKFEVKYGGSMKQVLGAMGMKAAFESRNEFDKIAPKAGLFVSDVFHKTFVRVDEAGTEAAAATAAVMAIRSAPIAEKTFVADHPFLYFLVEAKTSRVLFVGRLSSPK